MNLRLAQGIIFGVTFGLAIGVGAYTFVYARGYSYLSDNAEGCANCHVMQQQYRRLVEIKSSSCRGLQRLPHAAGARGQIHDQGAEWILAFLLLHHRLVRRQHPHHPPRPRR